MNGQVGLTMDMHIQRETMTDQLDLAGNAYSIHCKHDCIAPTLKPYLDSAYQSNMALLYKQNACLWREADGEIQDGCIANAHVGISLRPFGDYEGDCLARVVITTCIYTGKNPFPLLNHSIYSPQNVYFNQAVVQIITTLKTNRSTAVEHVAQHNDELISQNQTSKHLARNQLFFSNNHGVCMLKITFGVGFAKARIWISFYLSGTCFCPSPPLSCACVSTYDPKTG